ncbi:MAG: Trk system potassium transporter TrkA [Peptococcaceae bacterium]|jgi:trk system potassium uptake protein TrkA|nr:Trk system potassium transporter TrkA [Peptococcaceae bacterium]MDH7525227.1 Trk system potassium transporter TrkA [Peptococcaceae bacterium]
MRVIIIGAGKIGFNIAKLLAQQEHDVVIIEKDEERARVLQDNLDIQVITGNGASAATLQEAGVKEADLLAAVTEVDEVNMVACMLAKNFGVGKTVARVRNPEYLQDSNGMKKGVFTGIDLVINPELVTAKEIAKLIDVPEALDVVYFSDGNIQLLELKITPEAQVAGMYLKDLEIPYPFIIVAVFRKGEMLIPRGNDQILPHDIIFILARTKDMMRIERMLGSERKRAERVMILGGGFTGYHLARILEERKYHVKIIEKEYKRCLDLSNALNSTLVLHGDATDIDLLKAEGAGDADVFVCLTDDDKLNLLVSLIVKHLGAKKTVAQVRRSDYIGLMESVGIDVGISPRTLTANAILRFINRGSNVVSVTLLSNESAEMMEFIVAPESKVANKKLKDLNFPAGSIVGSIYRSSQVIIPKGDDSLLPGDVVTVFALPKSTSQVMDYFVA